MNATAFSPRPEILMQRASGLLDEGRTGAARPLLAAIARIAPPSPALALLTARLALREDRLDDAGQELDRAVERHAGDAPLYKLRAELRLRRGDLVGAAADAAEAVVLCPADPAGKALLGIVLLQLGKHDDAVTCLAEAVRTQPANPAFLQGLAAAQESQGDVAGAAATLDTAIDRCPAAPALRNAAVLLCLQQGDCGPAVVLADRARAAGAADACTFGLKGHALSSLGRHEEAAVAYAEAFKLAPEDPYVRHLVAAAGTLPGAARAPEPYVRALFDGYASRFETHILGLGYRVPGLFRAVLQRHLALDRVAGPIGPVLDLGCGTGLVAVASSDLPLGPWHGVDLSPRMLEEAAAKGLYETLHAADIPDWLATEDRRWTVVLAADVLCYFGALEEVFGRVRGRLAADGLFVVSLEERNAAGDAQEEPGWALTRLGRYAHTLAYVEAAARTAGLRVRELDRQRLREEAGAPVPGFIAVFEPAA